MHPLCVCRVTVELSLAHQLMDAVQPLDLWASQREYIIRAGTNRRAEDRQIETNTRTIEIIEDETRSVKRQLAETLALFSKKKEKSFIYMRQPWGGACRI